jgi:hypothetical protein
VCVCVHVRVHLAHACLRVCVHFPLFHLYIADKIVQHGAMSWATAHQGDSMFSVHVAGSHGGSSGRSKGMGHVALCLQVSFPGPPL